MRKIKFELNLFNFYRLFRLICFKHRYLFGFLFKFILKLRSCYLYNIFVIILFIINIPLISNSYAGGGDPPPDKCNASNVNDGDYCEAYDVHLPSWDSIRYNEYSSNDVYFDIKIPMTSNNSGYIILDKEYSDQLLLENGSCDNDDGAERFTVSDAYMKPDKHIRGKYCSSFRVGIDIDYLNSIPSDGYVDYSKLKIFCDDVETINSLHIPSLRWEGWKFVKNTDINAGSYLSSSDHYVCRDGVIHSGSPSCNVVTRYAVRNDSCFTGKYEQKCVKGFCIDKKTNKRCDSKTGVEDMESECVKYEDDTSKPIYKNCYKNDTSYDTGYISFKSYRVNICQKPVIKKTRNGIKIEKLYDPNLISQ